MLFLYFLFLSCCFSVSMGSAIDEFQANLEALVNLTKKELYLPVPGQRFQCNCVRFHLEETMKQLNKTDFLKSDQMKTHVFLMKKNTDHIIATFHKTHRAPEGSRLCRVKEIPLQRAPAHYKNFFQWLHEMCQKTG